MNRNSAKYWIDYLDLVPHPEGGYFKEVFRSSEFIEQDSLPNRYIGKRCLYTSIYYLLEKDNISKLHRLKSDEIWVYIYGCSAKLTVTEQDRTKNYYLGLNLDIGEKPQILMPADTPFSVELVDKSSFGLYSCLVIPGFEYQDWQLL